MERETPRPCGLWVGATCSCTPSGRTHDWYQLPKEERQELMNEHFVIGHKIPTG